MRVAIRKITGGNLNIKRTTNLQPRLVSPVHDTFRISI
jgi:hypothetical protein